MEESNNRADGYVEQLLQNAADTINENLSFMKAATEHVNLVLKRGIRTVCLDNDIFLYEPSFILETSIADSNFPVRILLHSLCHGVFVHSFSHTMENREIWNLACDIAVESMIVDLRIPEFSLAIDEEITRGRREIKRYAADMTAENIYRFFLANPPSEETKKKYARIFTRDIHKYQTSKWSLDNYAKDWRKISDRMKIELKVFSKNSGRAESFIGNLNEAAKPKYDYRKLLERFCKENDSIKVSEDEFDYIYYTFGITHYDGMPFVEPLELTKERDVKDFVIVLDPTPSCSTEAIKTFLLKTYDIVYNVNRYSGTVVLHIIQNDDKTFSDKVLSNQKELDAFVKDIRPAISGGTDFRPAFEYVNKLIRERAFNDFRGVIYFTDGYGIFPGRNPGLECVFAFLSGNFSVPEVPWWATPIILDENSLLFS